MYMKYPFMIIDSNLNTIVVSADKIKSLCMFKEDDITTHKNRKELNSDIIKFLNGEFEKVEEK